MLSSISKLFSEKKIQKTKSFWIVVAILLILGIASNDRKTPPLTAPEYKTESAENPDVGSAETTSAASGENQEFITDSLDESTAKPMLLASSQPVNKLNGWYQIVCNNGPVFGESIPERRINCGDRQQVSDALYATYQWIRSNSATLNEESYEDACFEAYTKLKELPEMEWDSTGNAGAMYVAECANSGLVSAVHKIRGW